MLKENDLVAQLKGRSNFLRDRGEVKTPELLEQAIDALTQPKAGDVVPDDVRKDAERYRWIREHSRDPDDGLPYAVIAEYRDDLGLCQHHICFEEKLDQAIDAALISQKVEG